VVDETFPSSRSFKEVVDLALNDLDGVCTAMPVADTPGVEVPRPEGAVWRRFAVARCP